CPHLTVEDIKIKYGALRSHFLALNRRNASDMPAGSKLQLPYWYEHMEFLRPHIRGIRMRVDEGGGGHPGGSAKKFKQDDHLEALDSILGTKENNADLPLTEESSEDDELSHISFVPQRHHHSAPSEERSPYEPILNIAKDALQKLAQRQRYSPDVDAFGEVIKAEMQSIQNPSQRKRLRNKLMKVIIEHSEDD
ncbi:hypothetical protein KR067_002827, partial [Drosophila pandora]